jgi:CubicO group peptidase (beta-lactamase class C family)
MCAALAAMPPLWFPGTQSGYHAWTFGWLVGELVRRVSGVPIHQFVQDELCRPLGIADFYLGIPAEVEPRVATLVHGPPPVPAPPISELGPAVMPAHVTHADVVNRSDVRRSCIPGGGGIMNARAIARHYAMLAERGTLDGVRIVSPERIDQMRAQQVDAFDIVGLRHVRRGMGYQLGGSVETGGEPELGRSGREFGHSGLGGSVGFAHPEQRLSFGLTKTLLVDEPEKTKLARYRVATLIRDHLGRW